MPCRHQLVRREVMRSVLGAWTREEGTDGVSEVLGLFGFFRLPPCLVWDQSFEEVFK